MRQQSASAANDYTWNASATPTDTNWGDSSNWTTDTANPAPLSTDASDNLTFTGTYSGTAATLYNEPGTVSTTANLLSSVNSITFLSGASAFTLNQGTSSKLLTIGSGGIQNNSGNLQTFGVNTPIAVAAGVSTTFNGGTGGLSFSSNISPAILVSSGATLTFDGSGSITTARAVSLNGGTMNYASTFTGNSALYEYIFTGTSDTVNVYGGQTISSSYISFGPATNLTINTYSAGTLFKLTTQATAGQMGTGTLTVGGSAGTVYIGTGATNGFQFSNTAGTTSGPFIMAGGGIAYASFATGTTSGITVNSGSLLMDSKVGFYGDMTVNAGGNLGLGPGGGSSTVAVGYFGQSTNVISLAGGNFVGDYNNSSEPVLNNIDVVSSSSINGTYLNHVTIIGSIIGNSASTLTFDASQQLSNGGATLTGGNTFAGLTQFYSTNSAFTTNLTLDSGSGVAIAGNLEIDGQNVTSVHSSGVILAASNQIAAASSVVIDSGYLNLNGFTNSISAITMTGGSLMLPSGSSILGATNLIVGDTATLDLTGNTLVGGYMLSSGQSLSGNGIVLTGKSTSPLILASGATLHPGDAPGVLNIGTASTNGNISIAPSSNLVFDLSGGSSNSDMVALKGLLNFGGSSGSTVNLSLANVTLPSVGNSATYELFTYGSYSGDVSSDITDDFSILLNGSSPNANTTVDVTNGVLGANQIDVVVASVPEPASLSLLGLGLFGLLGRRRKRRKS